MCCNNGNNRGFAGGFFANYQTFWIIVVIAVVIIWVHYAAWSVPGQNNGNCCCNEGCGCDNCCNPCNCNCNPCCNPCCC